MRGIQPWGSVWRTYPTRSTGECGDKTVTTHAAIDMDGDGRPEHTWVGDPYLLARSIVGASGELGALDSGRPIEIGNGYGARQVLEWTSAKRELRERRDLPRPEIVVSSRRVVVDDGLGLETPVVLP